MSERSLLYDSASCFLCYFTLLFTDYGLFDSTVDNKIQTHVVSLSISLLQASKMISKNAADTLRSFCKWQHDINVEDDADPRHHDTAVLLTRYQLIRSLQMAFSISMYHK